MRRAPYCLFVGALTMWLALAFPGCSDSTGRVDASTNPGNDDTTSNSSQNLVSQKYLFEVYYINFAWGYQHHGIFVDRDGNVFSYSYGRDEEPWQPRDYSVVDENELNRKYDHNKELIATVDRPELIARYQLIPKAAAGQLSELRDVGCDMGGVAFNAFSYDPASKLYTVVRLRLSGDFEQENLSDEARQLYEWLNTLWDKNQ